ncbi:hypothetical protein GCM10009117_08350 [Gangjinia marincola]|uniref:Metallo-beta-lactamase domain-containing protein n=1 Tax=Gangjinia marincola TaxID=578463 RepID=A0ABP3XV29_9FLAO
MSEEKLKVFSRLDQLRTAVYGHPEKILSDTFLMKIPKHVYRFGNTYAIRHLDYQKILLIDAVRPENKEALQHFKDSGYEIAGIVLTHGDLLDQAYTSLDEIANEWDTTIYMHLMDAKNQSGAVEDVMTEPDALKAFGLKVYHMPGHTSGSIMLYTGINEGMLFTGDSAVGSPYESDEYYFERPPITNEQTDYGLIEAWRSFNEPVRHMLPLHGKPQFDMTDQQQADMIRNLIKDEPTKSL